MVYVESAEGEKMAFFRTEEEQRKIDAEKKQKKDLETKLNTADRFLGPLLDYNAMTGVEHEIIRLPENKQYVFCGNSVEDSRVRNETAFLNWLFVDQRCSAFIHYVPGQYTYMANTVGGYGTPVRKKDNSDGVVIPR